MGQADSSALEGFREGGTTRHVRETAANLVLGRALQTLDGACGTVAYRDVDGRWNTDRFVLPGRPDSLDQLAPVFTALVEWTLYTERPLLVSNLEQSRWSRHLLSGADPPGGAIVASPVAQGGTIWGAVAVYRTEPVADSMEVLRQLAEVATEPLSALNADRPEGIAPQG